MSPELTNAAVAGKPWIVFFHGGAFKYFDAREFRSIASFPSHVCRLPTVHSTQIAVFHTCTHLI